MLGLRQEGMTQLPSWEEMTRECPEPDCGHRHPKGEWCGHPIWGYTAVCRCEK